MPYQYSALLPKHVGKRTEIQEHKERRLKSSPGEGLFLTHFLICGSDLLNTFKLG